MMRVNFDSMQASKYYDCLIGDKKIDAPEGGWTRDSMFALAGACLHVCECNSLKSNVLEQHREHLEAEMTQIQSEVLSAIVYCGALIEFIECGTYLDSRELRVVFDVEPLKEWGGEKVFPVQGFAEGWQTEGE